MYNPIPQRLKSIEQAAQQIKRDIQAIYGFCEGMAAVAEDFTREQKNGAPVEVLHLQEVKKWTNL